jgi:hypothetical protein
MSKKHGRFLPINHLLRNQKKKWHQVSSLSLLLTLSVFFNRKRTEKEPKKNIGDKNEKKFFRERIF